MAEIIRMPRLSDTMEEGNIVGWLKKVGDEVEPGDVLAEVETDKATMEVESFYEGVLLHIGVEEGPVPVNGVIAVIGEEGEDYQSLLDAEGGTETPASQEKASEETPQEEDVDGKKQESPKQQENTQHSANNDDRIKASPLAKSIAAASGVTLDAVKGTGENGRIIKRDIEAYIETQSNKPSPSKSAPVRSVSEAPANLQYEDVPVSQMRKVIARRLGESKFDAPHFYLTVEVNMDNAFATRKRINGMIAPNKVSFNDLVVKAAAAALQQHPAINSSWMGDVIRKNKDINIGVAVAVEDGLLVPVIRNANGKTLTQINAEVAEKAGKAKDRKLSPDEMSGNTFTISNLGMFGIEEFTAIINPPDSCILAVGAIKEKAIVKDGELAIGKMMKVTLSCDHRVVDGATGAKFLNSFQSILEDPIKMIV